MLRQKILELNVILATIQIYPILRNELLFEEMVLEQVLRNEMMETYQMVMDVKMIEVLLKLAISVQEALQLLQIHE